MGLQSSLIEGINLEMTKTTTQRIENCPLAFECHKKWSELAKIQAYNHVRYCGECQKPVFKVTNEDQYKQHAEKGHCVALAFDELIDIPIGETLSPILYK